MGRVTLALCTCLVSKSRSTIIGGSSACNEGQIQLGEEENSLELSQQMSYMLFHSWAVGLGLQCLEHSYLVRGLQLGYCLQALPSATNEFSCQLPLSLIGLFLHGLSLLPVRKIVFF